MYPKAYYDYLIYFHGYRDYFECHEVLEEHWKLKPRGKRDYHWVGLIQIAVGLYHERRGNITGAKRMLSSALTIIQSEREEIRKLGLDSQQLMTMLSTRVKELSEERPVFSDMNLPIIDHDLLITCQEQCQHLGITWAHRSDLNNNYLIHKHKKRDRSEVIEERTFQIKKRHTQQNN
ncbi:DUF309 domain-containing protein [Halalkalibacter urbisdiaboli]|uniref:DUF309 domain-containing protein n=1 Tax=Halalkalibacter urbisdiaboli TaxID=1960589 RepID=UPI000B442CDC|nr:DUF309 domain-containing protein [Halalkalibacter urbisdiaboli]